MTELPASGREARIISIHSFRGGTGKSNTTANLAAQLAGRGYRVGVIDTDIQSPGIHAVFGCAPDSLRCALNDYLWGRAAIEDAAVDVTESALSDQVREAGRIFLVPSALDAGEIARVLREGYDVGLLSEGFRALIDALDLDFLLIDTHPGVNEETLLSIALSDLFVLILRPDTQDFQGSSVTLELARRLGVRKVLVALNKVPPGVDQSVLVTQVEDAYQASVGAVLPLSNDVARMGSGAVFSTRHPTHPFSLGIDSLTRRVVDEISA